MDDHELDAFGRTFAAFLETIVDRAPATEAPLVGRLRAHRGVDPLALPIVSATFAPFEHPDVQLAVDGYAQDRDRTSALFGLSGPGRRHMDVSELLGTGHFAIGPVLRTDMPVGVDETMACIEFGFVLIDGPDEPPHVLVVRLQDIGMGPALHVDVISREPDHARAVLADVRTRMRRSSVFRGKVFSLSRPYDHYEHSVGAVFMRRPAVDRDDIVLPPGVLERIERRTVDFDAVAEALAAQGQARKRGVLLYGPPGSGKTLTARYLIGRLTDRTTIVLTGTGLGAIGAAANLARRLQPALLVLEDVDLIAQERDFDYDNPLLFELLNELDGIGEDSDVLTLLTTNRADLLEPALAARPGRVDLAVELPAPGVDEQRRLLTLYTSGVDTDVDDWHPVIDQILGTPASFVRELIRTAVLHATHDGASTVRATHVDAAVTELLDSGPVTPRLHGVGAPLWHEHDDA
jgi:cell division protease FtsH